MSLTLLDIIAIIAYLALCVVIGLKVGGRPGDTDSYFTSRGSVPWWAVSFSIVATETSMLTVISVPAVAYLGSLAFFSDRHRVRHWQNDCSLAHASGLFHRAATNRLLFFFRNDSGLDFAEPSRAPF